MPAGNPGSQPGFYEEVLDQEQRAALEAARRVEGIDEDVAVLRTLLRSELAECVVDRAFVYRSVNSLLNAHDVRERVARRSRAPRSDDLVAGLRSVLDDLGGLLDGPDLPIDA